MLRPRLLACARQVRTGSVAADIGTDHGLLAVYLIRNGICPKVIACDLREGPLAKAAANVRRFGSADRIDLRLSDGLSALAPGEAQDIVAAGMGGELTARILAKAPWIRDPAVRLILQPMSRPEAVRVFLYENGFEIENETAVRDAGRVYTVLTARFADRFEPVLPEKCHLGALPAAGSPEAVEYLERHLGRIEDRIQGLGPRRPDSEELRELTRIRDAVSREIRRMKQRSDGT